MRLKKKKRGQKEEEGGQRGGSSRPGLLPARTRHDVRRGRGRPPQPVGGGCQGLAAGGALRGEPSWEVIFLGVPQHVSFGSEPGIHFVMTIFFIFFFARRDGNLPGTWHRNKSARLFLVSERI